MPNPIQASCKSTASAVVANATTAALEIGGTSAGTALAGPAGGVAGGVAGATLATVVARPVGDAVAPAICKGLDALQREATRQAQSGTPPLFAE